MSQQLQANGVHRPLRLQRSQVHFSRFQLQLLQLAPKRRGVLLDLSESLRSLFRRAEQSWRSQEVPQLLGLSSEGDKLLLAGQLASLAGMVVELEGLQQLFIMGLLFMDPTQHLLYPLLVFLELVLQLEAAKLVLLALEGLFPLEVVLVVQLLLLLQLLQSPLSNPFH